MMLGLLREDAKDEAPEAFTSPSRTLAPSAMKRVVIAAPKPAGEAPPVIKATLPERRERDGVDGAWAGVVAGAVDGALEGPGAAMFIELYVELTDNVVFTKNFRAKFCPPVSILVMVVMAETSG